MSSNININRICQYCGKEFLAKTTTTRYCSTQCNSKAYKALKKEQAFVKKNEEIRIIKSEQIEGIKSKEYLTVNDAAKLLNSSRQTIHNLIRKGIIIAFNLSKRKTTIKKSEIDKLFEIPILPTSIDSGVNKTSESDSLSYIEASREFLVEDYYYLKEIEYLFQLSEGTVNRIIKINHIPKIRKGAMAYVPKNRIIEILGQPKNIVE